MAIKIRLSRYGAKKRPFYRVVVTNSRSPRDGNFLEQIGSLNPMVAKDSAERFKIKEDRVKYWLGVGALPTEKIAIYLSKLGLVAAQKIQEKTKKHLPKAKAQERMKATEEAKAKPATEAPTTTQEAPVEEVPVATQEAPVVAQEVPVAEVPAGPEVQA